MDLFKKTYIGGQFEHKEVTGNVDIKIKGKPVSIKTNRLAFVVEVVGEWRKANHIHNWFITHCANGEDDCQDIYVGGEKLKELLKTCKQVIKSPEKAPELLPTQSGFFFGSTEYDESYFEDIRYTISVLESIIEEDPELNEIYIYSASW